MNSQLSAPNDAYVSRWFGVEQGRIDRFGETTEDRDPMHVDPDWCVRNSPYGETIAFGFFTLSMLTYLARDAIPWPDGAYGLNYGFDRVRFLSPVRVGARIRGRFTLISIERRDPGQLYKFEVVVEIEGEEKPALAAEWLAMVVQEHGEFAAADGSRAAP